MLSIKSTPGALRLFALSIVARLPLTGFEIALLVHAQHLTGSLSAAGLVSGAYALALGVGGPLLGRVVDRRGQTIVLMSSASAAAVLLIALAVLPVGCAPALIVLLAAGTGLVTPPLDACMSTLFSVILPNRSAVEAAYATDATVSELTWVLGPPLALCLGVLWSTGAALAIGGVVLVLATAAFAAQPPSRRWRPVSVARPRGGSLATPAMRTLVIVFVLVGVVFGAAEVGVTAAAEHLGSKSIAVPLLALWGAGSLVGGLIMVRVAGGEQGGNRLGKILVALTVGHLSLAAVAGNGYALAATLFVAGGAIAPAYASLYAVIGRVAPEGTLTEAFTWIGTAVALGGAIGVAISGAAVNSSGPSAAFVLAGAAGALATAVTTARRHTLRPPPSEGGRAPQGSHPADAEMLGGDRVPVLVHCDAKRGRGAGDGGHEPVAIDPGYAPCLGASGGGR